MQGRAVTRGFVGEEKIELHLGIVDRLRADYFVEMAPFAHDLIVLGN